MLVSARDGIYENSRSAPSFPSFPSRGFLPLPLFPRPSISLARNLPRRYMHGVHRLVMYFLRYIKPYILWDVRIAMATCRGGAIDCNGSARGDVKERREDTRVTPGVRASDVPSRVGYHNLSSIYFSSCINYFYLILADSGTRYSRSITRLSAR